MSLILEALKKAERQHKLGEVPGLGSGQAIDAPTHSRWLGLLLLSLVALAMLILGVYLGGTDLQGEKSDGTAEMSGVPPVTDQAVTESWTHLPQQPPTVPMAEAEQPASQPPLAPAPVALPSLQETSLPPGMKPTEPPSAPPDIAKSLDQLPDGFVSNLPVLNIDIHSYDPQAGRSYVLINLEKYREGDYLAEGPLLSEIVPDGVVLEHMGERFLLPIGNY